MNLDSVVRRLNACSELHEHGCEDCPDKEVCVKEYDIRCAEGETVCPYCGDSVPRLKFCSQCGKQINKGPMVNPKRSAKRKGVDVD